MKSLIIAFVFCLICFLPVSARTSDSIDILAGDTQGLIDAINNANAGTGPSVIVVRPDENGNSEFIFDGPAEGFSTALPTLTTRINIFSLLETVTFKAADEVAGEFRLFRARNTYVGFSGVVVENFGAQGEDGGAILLEGNTTMISNDLVFRNNRAGRNGGALATTDTAYANMQNCEFANNRAANNGGALAMDSQSRMFVWKSKFTDNSAGVFGCDANVDVNATGFRRGFIAHENVFQGNCDNVRIENPEGNNELKGNTFVDTSAAVDSTDLVTLFGNVFTSINSSTPQSTGIPPSGKEAICNDFGTGAFQSLGYNISADDSCALDQATDLPNTDAMIEVNTEGYPVPQAGSPAIDSGAIEAVVFDGDLLASLPCGYIDMAGTARPQDANADEIFECDRGAIEVPGTGEIVAGHSAVFFNPERNGEGNYVEILDDGRAVVYTFTYNPAGDGPAWFIGVGEYADNAIIMHELFRPAGAVFGDGFNAEDVEFTPAGSMSMVFPDCTANAPGGNIAYTGDVELGYEALITRATRLAHITGCGVETPDPNAGLSGSFFDPGRNGEGVIVEWLTNGDVLVVFFTYDPEGNQFWLFGQAAANGKTVTMTAVYPTGFTPWGRNFDANDVALSEWGTFTLTWTDCNTVTFDYNSTVAGFGMGSHSYTRLSTLTGTSCPSFP